MAFIIAASCSEEVLKEFRREFWPINAPPIHQDYALLKVLHNLRRHNNSNTYINHIQWTGRQSPLNFNALTEDDIIYISGHGNEYGLYATGPNKKKDHRIRSMVRLIDILTKDGSLKRKIQSRPREKPLKILLLSCRAGKGFYASLAQRLYETLKMDLFVGGAIGFTYGSPRTLAVAHNEVSIYGLPWWMDYGDIAIPLAKAEEATSNLEGKSITLKRKKSEIKKFDSDRKALVDKMKALAMKLKSKEINKALDELYANYHSQWSSLVSDQFDLYSRARINSKLEFDMWWGKILDGYIWTNGKSVPPPEVKAV
jgi:hypothetical protein